METKGTTAATPDDGSDRKQFELVSAGDSLEALTRGEIDVQIATAKRWPRTISKVRERILELATIDQEAAEACWYSLPREGKVITGPSVRLAEIVAASYQNLRWGSRIIAVGEKFVTCQGACFDLENNVASTTEVKRRITKKNGQRYSDDMIVITANAAGSIAGRNALFKVVPAALFRDVFSEIQQVGMGSERTLKDTRAAMFNHFENMGVDHDRVLKVIGKRAVEDVELTDVATLRGLANALKEGGTSIDEAFPVEGGSAKLKAGKHKRSKKAAAKPEPASAPTQQSTQDAPALPFFDRDACIDRIAEGLATIDQETFKKACAGIGIKNAWMAAGDGQLESLAQKVADLVAATE